MKELFTVMLVWDDEKLGDLVQRVAAERLRLVLVREGEPVAIMVPFDDHDALQLGLWEKGAKEHLAMIFGDEPPLAEPETFKTAELKDDPPDTPTDDNYDLFETGTLMKFEVCPRCGKWVGAARMPLHTCAP